MLKAVKVKLYLNPTQITTLSKLFGCYRKIYNLCLDYKTKQYELDNKSSVNLKELGKLFHNELTKNPDYFYLNEHNTKVLKQSIIDLLVGFKNFFESCKGKRKGEKIGYPNFKSKFDKQSVRFPSEAISSNFITGNSDRMNLTKDFKNMKFRCSDSDKKYLMKYINNIKSVTISRSKSGLITASILIDGGTKNEFRKDYCENNDKIIGIDLGIKTYFVSYDGEESKEIENPKFTRNNEKRLKRIQRKLSRLDNKNKKKRNDKFRENNGKEIDLEVGKKIVNTNNRYKLKKKLAKANEKIRNKKETFLHELTSKLVNENQVIVIEDLNVKGMMKNHNLAKSIQELNLGEFKTQLEYKCRWDGKDLIKINRFYPSSKLCSCCGNKKMDLTLKDRTYVCTECGLVIDRDLNAAINIRNEGERIYIGSRCSELKLEDYPPMDEPNRKVMLKSCGRMIQEEIVEFNRIQ